MKSHFYHLFVTIIFGPGDKNKTSIINKCFRVRFNTWKWKRAHNHTCKYQTYTYILTYIKQVRMNADEKICKLIFFILFYNFPKSLLHLQNKVVNLFSTVKFCTLFIKNFKSSEFIERYISTLHTPTHAHPHKNMYFLWHILLLYSFFTVDTRI